MIYLVGGTRPNFMKIAPISRAFDEKEIRYEIIHTGQHYDENMNKIFFKEFGLKKPMINFNVGSGNHGEQTGKIMTEFEKLCIRKRPDLVFVVGDVNSTMAAALVASKLHIPLAHQEAGMRSGDKKMPEEINRIVTDHVSDYLFPISPQDRRNLYYEGIEQKKITLAGDVMTDNLLYYTNRIPEAVLPGKYILVEIHRPANTDNKDILEKIISELTKLSDTIQVIFTIHPRTKKMIKEFGLWSRLSDIDTRQPMGYFEFITHMKRASAVITDSDGVQQETSILNIPCFSVRDTTNIEYTVQHGTNTLAKPDEIYEKAMAPFSEGVIKENNFSEELKIYNDGNAAKRIVEVIEKCVS